MPDSDLVKIRHFRPRKLCWHEDVSRGKRSANNVAATDCQHSVVRQKRHGRIFTFYGQIARVTPAICSGVINFCAADYAAITLATYHQNAPICERSSAMLPASLDKRGCRIPFAGARIKVFRNSQG